MPCISKLAASLPLCYHWLHRFVFVFIFEFEFVLWILVIIFFESTHCVPCAIEQIGFKLIRMHVILPGRTNTFGSELLSLKHFCQLKNVRHILNYQVSSRQLAHASIVFWNQTPLVVDTYWIGVREKLAHCFWGLSQFVNAQRRINKIGPFWFEHLLIA